MKKKITFIAILLFVAVSVYAMPYPKGKALMRNPFLPMWVSPFENSLYYFSVDGFTKVKISDSCGNIIAKYRTRKIVRKQNSICVFIPYDDLPDGLYTITLYSKTGIRLLDFEKMNGRTVLSERINR